MHKKNSPKKNVSTGARIIALGSILLVSSMYVGATLVRAAPPMLGDNDGAGDQAQAVCGNGIKEINESCDGTDGVGAHQSCTTQCTLRNLTYCSDGTVQNPNDEAVAEQCDDGNLASGDGCDSSCQTETPPPSSSSGGAGGGGGGGGFIGLQLFNEASAVSGSTDAQVNWFTNIPATSRVVYDTISHDGSGPPPNYGYAFSTPEDPAKLTYRTIILNGLQPGTTYFWRAISSASPEQLGPELSFTTTATLATIANPTVLGFTTEPEASPAAPESPKVLGFSELPKTGDLLDDYYLTIIPLFTLALTLLYAGYRRSIA